MIENLALQRFPGLRPFTEAESSIFFGRETEVRAIRLSSTINPITLCYGQSGAGKSSIISCGLIPYLNAKGIVVARLRASRTDSSASVQGAFLPCESGPEPTLFSLPCDMQDTENTSKMFSERIAEALDEHLNSEGAVAEGLKSPTVVLVFDQFEEIFIKFDSAQRKVVLNFLTDQLSTRNELSSSQVNPEQVNLLLALRSEYVGHLAALTEYLPGVFDSLIHIHTMPSARAAEVIRQTIRLPRSFNHNGAAIELDSDSFEVSEKAIELWVEECKTNTDDDGVNLLLLQAIGGSIISKINSHRDAAKETDGFLDREFIKDSKRNIVNRMLKSSFEGRISRPRKLLQEMLTGDGKRRILRDGELRKKAERIVKWSRENSGEDLVNGVLKSNLIREERLFSDIRYEISHDFIADAIHRRRSTLNYLKSFAGTLLIALGIGLFIASFFAVANQRELRDEARSQRDSAIVILQANESALDEVQSELQELYSQRDKLDAEISLISIENRKSLCEQQHGRFIDAWTHNDIGGAHKQLITLEQQCDGSEYFSAEGVAFLSDIANSFFIPPVLTAQKSGVKTERDGPSALIDRTNVLTRRNHLVQFELEADGSAYQVTDRTLWDAKSATQRSSNPHDDLVALLDDGIRTLLQFCMIEDEYDTSKRTPRLVPDCEAMDDSTQSELQISSIEGPLWARIEHRNRTYFMHSDKSNTYVCDSAGYCGSLERAGRNGVEVSAIAVMDRKSSDQRDDGKGQYSMVSADEDGYLLKHAVSINSCATNCTIKGVEVKLSLETVARKSRAPINRLRVFGVPNNQLILVVSDGGLIQVLDPSSLVRLSSLFTTDRTASLVDVSAIETDNGGVVVTAIDDAWKISEWAVDRISMRSLRNASIMPTSVALSGKDQNMLAVGGRYEQITDGSSRGDIGLFITDGDQWRQCRPYRFNKDFRRIERLSFVADEKILAVGLAYYPGNRDFPETVSAATAYRGGLGVARASTQDCTLSPVAGSRRNDSADFGAVHSVYVDSGRSIYAGDFAGNVWVTEFDAESTNWKVPVRNPVFSSARRITTLGGDASGKIFAAVRRRYQSNQETIDTACVGEISRFLVANEDRDQRQLSCQVLRERGALVYEGSDGPGRVLRWMEVGYDAEGNASALSLSGDGFVDVVKIEDGATYVRKQMSLPNSEEIIWRTGLIRNNEILAGVGGDGNLHFWDVQSGATLVTLDLPTRQYFGENLALDLAVACDAENDCRLAVPLVEERTVADILIRNGATSDRRGRTESMSSD
ncbi:MAG: hypothetical protein QNJ14_09685 [Woeseiaceae bacterium]|nr:hypothetical protein [Woeseiaceae bacterium]